MMIQPQRIIKILFVCYGNVCRSPMAEFVMRDIVDRHDMGEVILVASAATSREALGNPVYPGTRDKLLSFGISTKGKRAVQMVKADYGVYDYLLGMEQKNVENMLRITGGDPKGKIRRLLDFGQNPRDIDDPWYTGDFDVTYEAVYEGCQALFAHLLH